MEFDMVSPSLVLYSLSSSVLLGWNLLGRILFGLHEKILIELTFIFSFFVRISSKSGPWDMIWYKDEAED
jgi:hypothetical protein